jgi:hypothetical protein
VTTAAILMAAAAWSIEYAMTQFFPGRHVLMQGARLGASIGGGLVVLAAAARAMRIREFTEVVEVFMNRAASNRGYGSC